MKFIPKCRVSYGGSFYTAGTLIDIDPKDAEEMSKYGVIAKEPCADRGEPNQGVKSDVKRTQKEAPKKRTRSKKPAAASRGEV